MVPGFKHAINSNKFWIFLLLFFMRYEHKSIFQLWKLYYYLSVGYICGYCCVSDYYFELSFLLLFFFFTIGNGVHPQNWKCNTWIFKGLVSKEKYIWDTNSAKKLLKLEPRRYTVNHLPCKESMSGSENYIIIWTLTFLCIALQIFSLLY